MTELQIVEWLRRHTPTYRGCGVLVGIGDDCAVYRPRASRQPVEPHGFDHFRSGRH